jgi:hypothetical protein
VSRELWRGFSRSAVRNLSDYAFLETHKEVSMRGVILWLLGVPISIIILLYLFNIL